MERKERIGIMGGTFNPIHIGHLLIAEAAREALKLNSVLFIPSGYSYMKDGMFIPSGDIRLAMTKLATADNPYFSVSDMEILREGNTYTYETIDLLKNKNPFTEYVFIVGADTLFTMETWKKSQQIFESCDIAAAIRDHMQPSHMRKQIAELSEKYRTRIELLPIKEIDISSTDIRERIKNEQSIRYFVPEKVREYIMNNQLYQE